MDRKASDDLAQQPANPSAMAAPVGLIGLGSMGSGIAANLVRKGHAVIVHDRATDRVDAAVAFGAEAGSLDAVARAPIVLVSLPGPPEVEEVSGLLLRRMAAGSVLVNLSTVSVSLARRLAVDTAAQGVGFVDAPMTGAADGAREGRLVIMAGATSADLARVEPTLRAFSRAIYHLGEPGAGTTAKLLTNMLWFIHVTALSDALALGALEGLDLGMLGDVIRDSAGGSWVADHDLPNILAGDDDPSFTLALCTKDLRLIGELAGTHRFAADFARLAAERFGAAERRFGASAGELAVTRLVEAAAQVSIRAG